MFYLQRSHHMIRNIKKISVIRCLCFSDSFRVTSTKEKIKSGPGLKDFIADNTEAIDTGRPYIPYLPNNVQIGKNRKVYFDVYGCQMNVSDTEIVWSILKKEGFEKTDIEEEADVFLVMTCAIREGAETKIWHRLDHLRGFKRRAKNKCVKIGILGCMAERLKHKLIEKEKSIDLVAGPDSYRDLPRLLALTDSGQTAVNVLLSLDETYADVAPVRLNADKVTAFISVMRGCDNMCTYCIVPWTRGRERSRPAASVEREARALAAAGVRDVTLLGQNVNSYRDTSERRGDEAAAPAPGFTTVYKPRRGGVRFAELLERVASVHPELRVRFTAAHPKDFPDEVLRVVRARPNVCSLLHAPAQAGSAALLARMRRGYSPAAYRDLVAHIRDQVPGVGLSTDMMCGFCGETEEEFEETLELMRAVDYDVAYLFQYSMREKTAAHRRYADDVPADVKRARHARMLALHRAGVARRHALEVGRVHLALVEGSSPRGELLARNELGVRVALPARAVPGEARGEEERAPRAGEYVAARVREARGGGLRADPLYRTSLAGFYSHNSWANRHLHHPPTHLAHLA